MLRTALLAAARSPLARQVVERTPLARPVVRRFVAGSSLREAVDVTASLIADGRKVTLDHLGEDTTDAAQAAATVDAYERLLAELGSSGLAHGAEVSVKLSPSGSRSRRTARRSPWTTPG